MLQTNYVAELNSQRHSQSSRSSDSTTATQDESLSPCICTRVKSVVVRNDDPKMQMFRASKTAGEISQKLMEKAICWIQITGYTKNLSFETIFLSVSLFYAALNKVSISKKNIEPTICACMLLASKMSSTSEISMSDLLSLIENRQTASNIVAIEKNILQALDYNINFQFPLMEQIFSFSCEIQQQKAKFLTEILLIKDPSLLYDLEKVAEIVQLSGLDHLGIERKMSIKIGKILKKSSCQHLIKKYQSKFNVGDYIIQTDHISNFL